jgi:aspartate/methionine/tyrosine aminotransferase
MPLPTQTSKTARSLPRNGIRAIAALAATQPGVVNLVFGEPDFPTPNHVVEAADRAVRAGHTRYGPSGGLPQLREAAAVAISRRSGVEVEAAGLVVSSGAVQGIFAALRALADAGDGVLVPDPGWPSYAGQCAILGLRALPYPLDSALGFEPDLERLEQLAIVSGAKVLVLNSPGNPTGAVWSAATVRGCVDIAERCGMWVISDEVYDEIVFDGEHAYAAAADPDGRVVSVFSFSKTYAMTGWRVGYMVAPPEVAELMVKVYELEISCPSTPAQYGAIAALSGSQECVAEMRKAYLRRRDLAVEKLREAGLYVATPRGAFYILADVRSIDDDDAALAGALAVDEEGVACAPGSTFGRGGKGLLRISLAADADQIATGIERLVKARAESRVAPAGRTATTTEERN